MMITMRRMSFGSTSLTEGRTNQLFLNTVSHYVTALPAKVLSEPLYSSAPNVL